MRHRDFQRIYDEFCSYYKSREKGESEYYDWLRALDLDESVMYGGTAESFRWAQDMLKFIREDDRYKYYQVLVGFPTRSMNGNVYKERDLIAAAMSLKGLHPNLNHKDEWHFTPGSRYGEITTEAAKYEDGAIEAIIKVSKSAVCPICNGRRMTELIDNRGIVNVSLQGGCSNYQRGVCDGFMFDDKGFALLTKDVLPGIPMARIKPLEQFMVEALRTSSMTPKGRNTVKIKLKEKTMPKHILKPKLVEDVGEPCSPELKRCVDDLIADGKPESSAWAICRSKIGENVDTSTQTQKDLRGTWGTELTKDEQIWDGDKYDNAKTVVGTSPAKSFISGSPMGDTIAMTPRMAAAKEQEDNPATTNKEPEFTAVQGPFAPMDGPPTDETQPKPEDEKEGPPKTKPAPPSDMDQPEGTPPSFPSVTKPETTTGEQPPKADDKVVTGDTPAVEDVNEQPDAPCQPGYHKDADGYCVPNETPSEQNEPPHADPCPSGQHLNDAGQCVPDATEEEEPCPEGQHKDADGKCVPDAPVERLPTLEERRARIHAEIKSKSSEEKALRWEQKHNEIFEKYAALTASYTELRRVHDASKEEIKRERQQTNGRIENLVGQVELQKIQYNSVCGENTKLKNQLTDVQANERKWYNKYQESYKLATKSSNNATNYLLELEESERLRGELETKLTQARSNAKKTLKLKV